MTGRIGALAVLPLAVAILVLFRAGALFATNPVLLGLQICAFLLMLWARVTFGRRSFHAAANPTEGGLVTTGPYRFVRHPIYSAVWWFVWIGALDHLSLLSVGMAVLASAMLLIRMFAEERLVVRKYPDYAEYARRTKRILPYVF